MPVPQHAQPTPKGEHGDGTRLFRVATEASGDFNAQELLELAAKHNPPLARRTALKNANDHLRRLAQRGALEITQAGKRGQKGSLPRYKVVRKAPPAAAAPEVKP
jgi:hypothetical protein